jgi:predicted ATPase
VNTPSGVVTFLFTDIEGSTLRWEADPDAMRAALAAHDELMREVVENHDGSLFKHTGDGVCAAFSSPRSAVDAAVAAQRKLQLPVRMGIATGEAELRGDDYFGSVLNRAARVMATGHGGQVLLDGPTTALLTDVDLVDLGPRRLRDIAKPVEISQVRADGLQSDFPRLRSLDATPGNLRTPTTSFVGREMELAELEGLLKAHRLVTLTGVGGVGKTRLALEVAARASVDFPDGVWVIELAAVGDPAAVPEAVAAVLGVKPRADATLSASIADALEGRSRLLVFDNCEHVLDAAVELIEAILTPLSSVKVLATSREGLRAVDERLWPVASLDVRSSAATLFADRAEAVAPGTTLDDAADTVIEICRRLDGIPLAIELAASRFQSMTVRELKDRLDDRFRLLVGARRGLERHQTLRHAVQWSYDLLDADEQTLMNRCSVFAGGFDLEAAHAVADSTDRYATLDLLDSLVRKSLVVADRSAETTRFSMLETIRQFAEEELVRGGDAEAVRTGHARYFAGKEADVLALWDSPHQREAYRWLAIELPNLRSAFQWATDNGDLDAAAIIASYAGFLGIWVEQYEGISWAEKLLESAEAVDHRRLPHLYVLAAECYATGRVDDSVGYADRAQAAIASGRFDEVAHDFEVSLGATYASTGQPDRWVLLCRKSIARKPGAHGLARAFLALALAFTGATDEAMELSDDLLATADAIDNPASLGYALLAHGLAHRHVDAAAAFDSFRRGLMISEASGNRLIESHHAESLGLLAIQHGDPTEVFDNLSLAIRHFVDAGSVAHLHVPLAVLSIALDRLGYLEAAATLSGIGATGLARNAIFELDTTTTHLRTELGDDTYNGLANAGKKMTNAAMAAYALDQIERARADLRAES